MYHYTFSQWILFFFIYCFVGWVWESCYVSVIKKQWVNRGFLHGPFLPIYGTGAIGVLFCTIGVRDQVGLIFLYGMIGATILEYITGALMEKLFKVRYWDYSKHKFNLNGHICLMASLGWGCFSVLLVRGIHLPIEDLILKIPQEIAGIIAFVLTVLFTVDFTQSFNEAMDLKDTLVKLSESNERIRRMQKRLEVVTAFAEDEYNQYQARKEEQKKSRKKVFEYNLERQRERRRKMLAELSRKINEYIEASIEKKEEMQKFKAMIEQELKAMGARTDKSYKRAGRLLHRNPGTVSKKYGEALKQVQDMLKKRK